MFSDIGKRRKEGRKEIGNEDGRKSREGAGREKEWELSISEGNEGKGAREEGRR